MRSEQAHCDALAPVVTTASFVEDPLARPTIARRRNPARVRTLQEYGSSTAFGVGANTQVLLWQNCHSDFLPRRNLALDQAACCVHIAASAGVRRRPEIGGAGVDKAERQVIYTPFAARHCLTAGVPPKPSLITFSITLRAIGREVSAPALRRFYGSPKASGLFDR